MTVDVKLTMPNSAKLMVEAIRVVKSSDNIDRFLKFAQMWYEDSKKNLANDLSYANEWMERFNKGYEYLDSDFQRAGYLLTIDGKENGLKKWAKELADYNGITMSEALSEVKKRAQNIKSMKGKCVRAPSKKHKKCICKSARIMIGKMPKIEGKNFL